MIYPLQIPITSIDKIAFINIFKRIINSAILLEVKSNLLKFK